MAKVYRYSNKGIKAYNGKDLLKIPVESGISTETRHIFLVILNNLDFKTNDDSIQGFRLATAIDEAEDKDILEIGEGVYDWLQRKLKEVNREGREICPMLFRVNGSFVNEFVKEGFEKPHEPKGKKEGKTREDAPPAEEPAESHPEEE